MSRASTRTRGRSLGSASGAAASSSATGWTSSCSRRPESAKADAVVVSTDGDNSNLVIGQVVQRRYEPGCVVVRILDPRRAAFYAERGLRTVCPTQTAIATLTEVVRNSEPTPVTAGGSS